MKVKYHEPTIIDRLDAAIKQARAEDKSIKQFELTLEELTEFCELGGTPLSKQRSYTYRDYKICYDWGRYK